MTVEAREDIVLFCRKEFLPVLGKQNLELQVDWLGESDINQAKELFGRSFRHFSGFLLKKNGTVHFFLQRIKSVDNFSRQLIDISCSSISPVIENDKHSENIFTGVIPLTNTSKYHFHTEKKLHYYPLNASTFSTIKLEFLNRRKEKLDLEAGKASFVQLRFRRAEKMTQRLNVKISSSVHNPSEKNNPVVSNLASHIKTRSKSKVGLASIFIPKNIRTVTEKLSSLSLGISIVDPESVQNSNIFNLEKGVYRTPSEFVQMMNECAFHIFQEDIFVLFDGVRLGVKMPAGIKKFEFTVPTAFHRIFGFPLKDAKDGESDHKTYGFSAYQFLSFENPMKVLDFVPDYVFCYCNIIKPSIVGSSHAPILKVFSVDSSEDSEGEYIHRRFEEIEYFSVNRHVVDQIVLILRGHDGRLLEFDSNEEIIAHLQFMLE